MKKKVGLLFSLVMILALTSGCLVLDDSTTIMGSKAKSEVKEDAREITDNFFKYNSYDPSTNSDYNAQQLVDLFKEDVTGDVVTIDPIIGGQYGKGLTTLENELNTKEALFAAFEGQLSNNDFNYSSYKLTFNYELIFNDNDIEEYTAVYRVKFQVIEEIDGQKIATPAGVPDGVTDNGTIEVHLVNETGGWLVNWMKIDFQEIGEVTIN